ncbi:LysR substrate-binding domain-containing protein [Octadecabacter sp. G9-8]|uniref:LysR substrate-binding domain-containing protein n=1 Tax=Octadecabacter dasysiphoniae TaxID=2909341 RepID=A0ABS9CYY1_9RHOB|nr:LysR substrate-binding domain-containing protein [Octadecabacter dasysiphoniae]MCF2872002.1 LysR substrate-binding domain-containing protein [Octadecabacter dasysiphoniae]
MRLNHRQLEAFRALIDTGSVTEAASRLHVTQPAASRLIADLEKTIGYALFLRQRKRLLPTPEAIALYEEVERSFIGLDTIADAAKDIGSFRRGALHIAGLPALALDFLPRVIAQFCDDRPDISVSLKIHSSPRVLQCVASQQFDIGFAETDVEHPSVTSKILHAAPFVAILPKGHKLLEKSVLWPNDFEGQNYISLGSDYISRRKIDAIFLAYNVQRIMNIESQLSMAVGNLVAAGAGVSIIDLVTARSLRDYGMIEIRPFLPEIEFAFRVLLPSHRPLSPLGETFLQIATEDLRKF